MPVEYGAGRGSASEIFIRESGFSVKNLARDDESLQGYHLRHDVFSKELRWVSEKNDELEIDEYDAAAVNFGVFDGAEKLCAYLRLLLPGRRFMLEKEFSQLVSPGHEIRKEEDTAEVSRLCVSPEARSSLVRSDEGAYSVSMLLYKGVYHWCLRRGVRFLYLVVEQRVLRLLKAKGFPCRPVGEPTEMPDGVIAVAGMMDWREFEEINGLKRPAMFSWFSRYQSTPPPLPRPLPESCLRHQACPGYYICGNLPSFR